MGHISSMPIMVAMLVKMEYYKKIARSIQTP
jgi:hypothetical protein